MPTPSSPPPPRFVKRTCGSCGITTSRPNGEYLKWKREMKGLGLRAFAAKVEVKHSAIWEIEANRRTAPARVLSAYRHL